MEKSMRLEWGGREVEFVWTNGEGNGMTRWEANLGGLGVAIRRWPDSTWEAQCPYKNGCIWSDNSAQGALDVLRKWFEKEVEKMQRTLNFGKAKDEEFYLRWDNERIHFRKMASSDPLWGTDSSLKRQILLRPAQPGPGWVASCVDIISETERRTNMVLEESQQEALSALYVEMERNNSNPRGIFR